ncbi:ZIP family metal transporter [Myxococcus sp. RHSTA-1-4]|uniref:ZIP family metal transporter n=1 Tax=Myxococcus sp. RHSTA-1-4 TaxID=2874601 RepID=UPI001CBFC70E|nr:ZIP family metal transporter [Myxococcus sp. RHSTA-1-4]MBZ4418080.1 ZIP family metal transporter [Myxococcus sp. RHSTA-1-4]
MRHVVLYTFLAVLADGLAGLASGLLSERWLRSHLPALVGFAAGTLLTVSFLEVLPEAVEALGAAAFSWAFASFTALALLEWRLGRPHHHPHGATLPAPTLPAALLGSDALHNIGDGAAVAAAFLVSPQAGIATSLAVIAHELPQEVGDYALLRASGWSRRRALLALAGVQLTAAVGAAGMLLGSRLLPPLEGIVLAIAAGTFFYIGAVDLLPELRHGSPSESRQRVTGLVLGVVLLLAFHLLEARLAT